MTHARSLLGRSAAEFNARRAAGHRRDLALRREWSRLDNSRPWAVLVCGSVRVAELHRARDAVTCVAAVPLTRTEAQRRLGQAGLRPDDLRMHVGTVTHHLVDVVLVSVGGRPVLRRGRSEASAVTVRDRGCGHDHELTGDWLLALAVDLSSRPDRPRPHRIALRKR